MKAYSTYVPPTVHGKLVVAAEAQSTGGLNGACLAILASLGEDLCTPACRGHARLHPLLFAGLQPEDWKRIGLEVEDSMKQAIEVASKRCGIRVGFLVGLILLAYEDELEVRIALGSPG